jgi:hypothetical protein
MRFVEIEWQPLGIKVLARLFDGPNAHLCDLFWRTLPYNSLQNHALVSGHHLYHLVPSVELLYTQAEHKEDRTQSPDGTLFLSQLQHLAIKYGPLSEYIPAAPVGIVVPEHMHLLREAGQKCWDATLHTKEIVEARIRRQGSREDSFPLPKFECSTEGVARSLLAKIEEETRKVWLQPPSEIVEMHRGNIRSRAGSYGQYFSTLVFLNGETRPLGYCALNGLVRLSQGDALSLDALREVTRTLIKTPAEFLGYCGLDTLWEFAQETLRVLPELRDKTEFRALIGSLALYANVLNTWNLQYFPWRHGAEYPAPAVPEQFPAPSAAVTDGTVIARGLSGDPA